MGVLDRFDESQAGDEYEGFLSAELVRKGQPATIRGLGIAKMDDGSKPYVILEGAFGHENDTRNRKMALILKRTNGAVLARLAREVGGEEKLTGQTVTLEIGRTQFRGKDVPTIDLVRGHVPPTPPPGEV